MNNSVVIKPFRLPLQLFSILFFTVATGCVDEPKTVQSTSHIRFLDDSLVNFNRQVVMAENQEIDDYISRYRWRMQMSPTGLRYMIYQHGSGTRVIKGATVRIRYSISLLTGEDIYSSKEPASRDFLVGHGGVESGIEEGILLLRKGDRAKFIVPSHLAFGLLGDLNKIPERAALVYDIEVLEVSRN